MIILSNVREVGSPVKQSDPQFEGGANQHICIRQYANAKIMGVLVAHSNMVLDVITFQTKDFLCHLSIATKHYN